MLGLTRNCLGTEKPVMPRKGVCSTTNYGRERKRVYSTSEVEKRVQKSLLQNRSWGGKKGFEAQVSEGRGKDYSKSSMNGGGKTWVLTEVLPFPEKHQRREQ